MTTSETWLLEWTFRAALLCGAGLLAVWALQKASAALRHGILATTILATLLVPLVVMVVQWIPIPQSQTSPGLEQTFVASLTARPEVEPAPVRMRRGEVESQNLGETSGVVPSTINKEVAETSPGRDGLKTPTSVIIWLWVAGVIVLGGRLVISQIALLRLTRRCSPIQGIDLGALQNELDLNGSVALCRMDSAMSYPPLTGGLRRPWIALPADYQSWPQQQLEAVLLHELAHIKRKDCATEHLCQVATVLQWWNPMMWVCGWRLRIEREHACDDVVVGKGASRSAYANIILSVTKSLSNLPAPGMARCGILEKRLRRILDRDRVPHAWLTWPSRLGLGFLSLLVVPLAWVGWAEVQAQERVASQALITGIVVDEQGAPVPNVRVYDDSLTHGEVRTKKDGRFRFPLETGSLAYVTLLASTDDSVLMGMWKRRDDDPEVLKAELEARIVVSPSRQIFVHVEDASGRPVQDAITGAVLNHDVVGLGRTSKDGSSMVRFPSSAKVTQVFAVKSGEGLDYYESYLTGPWKDPMPVPDQIDLVLDGAPTVQAKVVNPEGEPIPGVSMIPWFFQKPGKKASLNIGTSNPSLEMVRETDELGLVTFDYFPKEVSSPVYVTPRGGESYFQPGNMGWKSGDPAGTESPLQIELLKTTEVSGIVLDPDGQPAKGILLQAEGRGHTTNYMRERIRTDERGRFSFQADPEQSYLIAVTDPDWTAESLRGVVVREGRPVRDLSINLIPGTLVHGILRSSETGEPLVEENLIILEQGEEIDGNSLRKFEETYQRAPEIEELVRWASTDENGHFFIRLGPGNYTFFSPTQEHERNLQVRDQGEIRLDINEKLEPFAFDANAAQPQFPEAEFYIEESPHNGGHMRLGDLGDRFGTSFSIGPEVNPREINIWTEFMGTGDGSDFHQVKVTQPLGSKEESFEKVVSYRGKGIVIWSGDKYTIGIRPTTKR